jgi:integrase
MHDKRTEATPAAEKLPAGIRRRGQRWQVFAKIHGRFVSQYLPLDTPFETLTRVRATMIAEAPSAPVAPVAPKPTSATFAADAEAYLAIVANMTTFSDRAYRIGQWVKVFGVRPRSTITSREIRAVLEDWRRHGKADGTGCSIAYLNQFRTALMHLFSVLDGKSEAGMPNIVRDVPRYSEIGSQHARDVPRLTIARVLRSMSVHNQTRARLRILQHMGLPAALVQPIMPKDVDWVGERVRVPARDKGRGMPGAWVPVTAQALRAWRYLFRLNAQGPYSTSSMYKMLAAACERLKIDPFNPYQLKHTFATWAAPRVRDNDALRDLLRTKSIDRYISGAREVRMVAARDALRSRPRPAKAAEPGLPSRLPSTPPGRLVKDKKQG